VSICNLISEFIPVINYHGKNYQGKKGPIQQNNPQFK